MTISHLVIIVATLCYYLDKVVDETVFFYNPAYGVPDCDDTQKRCATV